jgi:predicted KAP-like P-loop ATPase
VRFNPWRFVDEAGLLRSFFDVLASSLEKSLTTGKEMIGDLMREYGGFASVASIEAGGIKWSAGDAIKDMGAKLGYTSLEELKEKVEDILIHERKRIIVLIDDIDRLDKTEIYAIFRLVKLTADFPYTSYVLAFDQGMVADALAASYGGGAEAGRKYVEKIVQVPLDLPAADPKALRNFCLEHVWRALGVTQARMGDQIRSEFLTKFYLYVAPAVRTPRDAKRYANALAFTMPLLDGEVHPLDVLLLEAVKIFYPILFSSIRTDPSAFTGAYDEGLRDDEESLAAVSAAIEMFDGANRARAEGLLLELFPQLRNLLRSKKFGSSSDSWTKGQRVAAEDYLKRYLTFSIPEGDISDNSIEALIRDLKSERSKRLLGVCGPSLMKRTGTIYFTNLQSVRIGSTKRLL